MSRSQRCVRSGAWVLLVLFAAGAAAQQEVKPVVSPDGKLMATAKGDTVALVEVVSGKEVRLMKGHTGAVSALAWSPDGKRLASGGQDRTVCLWDAPTGKVLAKIQGKAAVTSVSYSPDGKVLTVRGADNTTGRFDAATGKQLAQE